MKAITIWQPWASLIVMNKKHNETRSWATKYKGEILIHAAKKPYTQVEKLISNDSRRAIEETLNIKQLEYGAILGYVNLVDCVLITDEYSEFIKNITPNEYLFGDWTPGRYAWVFTDPIMFKRPITAKGQQGLWNFNKSEYMGTGGMVCER